MRAGTSNSAGATAGWARVRTGRNGGPVVDRYQTSTFAVGCFRCPPRAPQWRHANLIGPEPLVVVPHHAVEIVRPRAEPVLASPVRCVFYNADEEYERRLVDPRGDDCTYFAVRPDLLADVVATERGVAEVDPLAPFEREGGALGPDGYCRYQSLMRRLRRDELAADPEALLEPVLELVGQLVSRGPRSRETEGAARRRTAARRRALAHEVERCLARRFCEPLGLAEVAAAVGASPYHVARVFRAHTGQTVHDYRTDIRINVAIGRLADPRTRLTELALELGFSSHSHFTDRFRARLGMPPSVLRRRLEGRSTRAVRERSSTILEASPRPRA